MARKRQHTALWMFASIGLVALAGGSMVVRGTHQAKPQVTAVSVTRGDLVREVTATGTLSAVTTVTVGTQVSGAIRALYADFNDVVRKDQVLAELDPLLLQAQVEQSDASLVSAEAAVEELRVQREAARLTLDRTAKLAERQLVSTSDLESAQVSLKSLDAQIRSAEASVARARAGLNQARVNLGHTVITAPIDGIVVSRSVDVGQTVAASMSAPTLFTLAADLAKMRVNASLDESDIGSIESGQPVSFTVEAYPDETFRGRVSQVRLEATTSQNVVTYATVIDVENADLRLKPGMTATVSIEVARRSGVLIVPNAALRMKPPAAALASLGAQPAAPGAASSACASTRDCVTLWKFDGTTIRAVGARAGISDGTLTELLGPALSEGDRVVTAITMPTSAAKTVAGSSAGSTSSRSPLLGSAPPPPPGGGGPPPR
jgi:HlyD family secretion protein